MNKHQFRLILAASASALLSACASIGVPGFGDAGGCRTVYVVVGGGVQPVSNCGGLPRDTLGAKRMMAAVDPLGATEIDAEPAPVVTPISDAAEATAPYEAPERPYASPQEMIENADMAAYMARVREDYANRRNSGAWGYMIVDALAADRPAEAKEVLDELSGRPAPDWMSINHLQAWVHAANGETEDALVAMEGMRRLLPRQSHIAHTALLAEGMGDHVLALSTYRLMPAEFSPPGEDGVGTMEYYIAARNFQHERLMALREAELLRALDRNDDAIALLERLLAAEPSDGYVEARLERARKREDVRPIRTLKQAMAEALGDEADLLEEQEGIMAAMAGRGARTPFNYLLSSMRQSALLLDPDNGTIRISEAGTLYEKGKFEPALRIAQIGNPPIQQAALLQSTAGLAALQLGSSDTLEAMVERSLKIDASVDAKVQAAGTLATAGKTERALQLVDQALKTQMTTGQKVFALLTRAQAQNQGGNLMGAVQSAREARTLQDDETTKQFLASMLVDSPLRQEGLEIMRKMLLDRPDNTGLMNNLGYSLIDGPESDAELDEGFKLLKQAIRMTPDEANLLDSIGWAYYQYGDFREARRFIEMALEEYAPFAHWELSDHMGDIEWRLGDQEAARTHWNDSLKAYPPEHNKAKIEAKLREGLTTTPPARRDTPEVPLETDRGAVADI
jgi:tetratricopeptide (TPR) repeat protein